MNGLDHSNYPNEDDYEKINATPIVKELLRSFHEKLAGEMNRNHLVCDTRPVKGGFTYYCSNNEAFMNVRVSTKWLAVKFYTGKSTIDGLQKGYFWTKQQS